MYWVIIYDKKYEYPGDLFWLCKYVVTQIKWNGKEGINNLRLWIGLWIIVYILGGQLLLVPKIIKILYL